MLAPLMGLRTATMALVVVGMVPACASFSSDGMSAGLGEGQGSSSGGDSASSTSTDTGAQSDGESLSGADGSTGADPSAGSSGEGVTDSEDSAMGSSGGSSGGPQTGFSDGTYEGPMSIVMVSSIGTYTCTGDITLTVEENSATPVVGMGECDVTFPIIGTYTGVIDLSGQLVLPLADGTATLTTDVDSAETTWAGAIAGTTFTGAFNGVYTLAGYQVNYTGEWTADR